MSPRRSRSRSYQAVVVSVVALVLVLLAAGGIAGGTNLVTSPDSYRGGDSTPANAAGATNLATASPTSPDATAVDLDAGKATCPPDAAFPSDHGAAPFDGPVADCVVPEIDPGHDPIKKQAHPLPGATATDEQP